jgi:serine/threonine protein kinase
MVIARKGLHEKELKFFLHQILECLSDLGTSTGLCHGQLKLENIQITSNLRVKIRNFENASLAKKCVQSLNDTFYQAPESIEKKRATVGPTEIFSLGVILLASLSSKYPFREATLSDRRYSLII